MNTALAFYLITQLCSPRGLDRVPITSAEAYEYAQAFVEVVEGESTFTSVAGAPKKNVCTTSLPILITVASYENRWFEPGRVSTTRDVGLMQIHSYNKGDTVRLTDPALNINVGCRKLTMWNYGRSSCREKNSCANWFQKYNSRSKGYGERMFYRYKKVLRLVRNFATLVSKWSAPPFRLV